MNSTISMYCYFCEQTSPEGSLFCKPCGSPFHLAPCPRCAAVNALTVVSCYKCKAILPIRRAETKELVSNNKNAEPAVAHTTASEPVSAVPSLEVTPASELTPPAPRQESQETNVAKVEDTSAINSALPIDVHSDDYQKTIQLNRSPVEAHDENYQKTIALQRASMDVHDVGYQKTIPVRRPLEKVHDEDYQKTIALQRASASTSAPVGALQHPPAGAPQHPPAGVYDVNYQKTIALQRPPAEVHDEAYVKTISTRHPPTSLVGGAVRQVAAKGANLSSSAMPADLHAEYAALQSIDVVQKAKWGQRALMASAALLLIVTGAYFFLRSEHSAVAPVSRETEALQKLPAAAPGKVLEPLPLNVKVDGANRAADTEPNKLEVQTPILLTPKASPTKTVTAAVAKPSAPANQQTKLVPNDRVLLMPPDATKLSAAATAAAIAAALGKAQPAQPMNKSDATKAKSEVQVPAPARAASNPAPANIPRASDAVKDAAKDSASPAATSPTPAQCTEALAALGLCVLQPAAQKP